MKVRVLVAGDVSHRDRDVLNPLPRLLFERDDQTTAQFDLLLSGPSLRLVVMPTVGPLTNDEIRSGLARFGAARAEELVERWPPMSLNGAYLVLITDEAPPEGIDFALGEREFVEFLGTPGSTQLIAEGEVLRELMYDDTTVIGDGDAGYRPFPSFVDFEREVDRQFETWDAALSTLNASRALGTPEVVSEALRVLLLEAATDTGAIEGLYQVDRGFTWSVARELAAWDAIVQREKGHEVAKLIAGQLAAYELALDIATGSMPIGEAVIRRIHEEACAGQDAHVVHTVVGPQERVLERGRYKTESNHVTLPDGSIHPYAPVLDTIPEMARFTSELRSTSFDSAHAIVQAAYAHYALTAVHPFADGNGRVARVLASVYLLRASSVPLVVFADEKPEYLAALEEADLGSLSPIVRFIYEKSIGSIRFAHTLIAFPSKPHEHGVDRLRNVLIAQGDLSHSEVDGVAGDLIRWVLQTAQEQIRKLVLPVGVEFSPGLQAGRVADDGEFRTTVGQGPEVARFTFVSRAPAEASVSRSLRVRIARTPQTFRAFRLEVVESGEALDFGLGDAHPVLGQSLKARARVLVNHTLNQLLEDLTERAAESLRSKGF